MAKWIGSPATLPFSSLPFHIVKIQLALRTGARTFLPLPFPLSTPASSQQQPSLWEETFFPGRRAIFFFFSFPLGGDEKDEFSVKLREALYPFSSSFFHDPLGEAMPVPLFFPLPGEQAGKIPARGDQFQWGLFFLPPSGQPRTLKQTRSAVLLLFLSSPPLCSGSRKIESIC